MSSKGVNKKQNELRWERYERALEGYKDMVTNRGFRMHQGAMYTHVSFRVLRQALGAGGWHPHRVDRVPHAQLNKRQPRQQRSCNTISSRCGGCQTAHQRAAGLPNVSQCARGGLLFCITFVTFPINSRPGSTCNSCGHFKGPRL